GVVNVDGGIDAARVSTNGNLDSIRRTLECVVKGVNRINARRQARTDRSGRHCRPRWPGNRAIKPVKLVANRLLNTTLRLENASRTIWRRRGASTLNARSNA